MTWTFITICSLKHRSKTDSCYIKFATKHYMNLCPNYHNTQLSLFRVLLEVSSVQKLEEKKSTNNMYCVVLLIRSSTGLIDNWF